MLKLIASIVLSLLSLHSTASERVIAVVEGTPILASDLDAVRASGHIQQATEALELLILHQLQLQQARALGIQVPDNLRANPQLLAAQLDSPLALDPKRLEESLLIRTLQEQIVQQRVRVNNRELEDYLRLSQLSADQRDVRLQLLIIPWSPDIQRRTEQWQRSQALARQLQNSHNFRAQADSLANSGIAQTRDLGWRPFSQLAPSLQTVLGHLEEGDVSAPAATQQGIALYRVDAWRASHTASETHQNQKDIARQALFAQKAAVEIQAWQSSLRDHAAVEILAKELIR